MNLKTRVLKQQKKKIRKTRFYHSFFTIVLLICVFQIGYSALLNLAKIVVYQNKISKAKKLKLEAEAKNRALNNEIQNFSSMHKLESIARNNLKMAGKDEILIIINQPDNDKTIADTNDKKHNKFIEFLESFATKYNIDTAGDKIPE